MIESQWAIANARMGILPALRRAGTEIGDFSTGSIKVHCPFGFLHIDGGYDKAMRVYPDTNSAHCFAGCGTFTPVKLLAKIMDISDREAVDVVLEETGYVAPDYASRWASLHAEPLVDHDGLSEALKVACARLDPTWEARQFEDVVSAALTKCLGLLPKVTTPAEATMWLSTTKQYMTKILRSTS